MKTNSSGSHFKIVFVLISLSVTIGVFWYLFSVVSLSTLKTTITSISLVGLSSFIVLSLTGSLIRTWRYQLTLGWSSYSAPTIPLFLITLVRNLFADLLPARIGTAIFIYLANNRLGIPVAAATSTFALALIFDILSLPIILAAFLILDSSFNNIPYLKSGMIIISIMTIITVMYFRKIVAYFDFVFSSSLKSSKNKKIQFLKEFINKVLLELGSAKNSIELFKLLAYSIMIRAAKYGSLIAFLYALLVPLGISYNEVPSIKAFIGILASELSASLPISGLAGFGLYEGTWAFTFRLLGLNPEIADITAITHHFLTQVYGYSLGAFAFLALLLLPALKGNRSMKTINFSLRLFVALCLISTGLYIATHIEQPLNAQEKNLKKKNLNNDQYKTHLIPADGSIFFDSNRRGNFGIYRLSNDKKRPQRIMADKNYHYMYPAVSQNSGDLLFAKSKTTNRLEPGEIWLWKKGSSSPEPLISAGTFPSFANYDKEILYEKNRKAAYILNLETNKSKRIFPPAGSRFEKYQIVKPRLSSDGRYLTFTSDLPSAWHVWLIDLKTGEEKLITHGCESSFHPNNLEGIFIIQRNVYGGSAIGRFTITPLKVETFYDPQIEKGHEYFPSISPYGELLLYSAAPNDQHSHLTDNYSIFIKNLKGNSKDGVRITYDKYTNRWPTYATQNLPK